MNSRLVMGLGMAAALVLPAAAHAGKTLEGGKVQRLRPVRCQHGPAGFLGPDDKGALHRPRRRHVPGGRRRGLR